MICPSSDPIADFFRNEDEIAEYESKCPVCDVCGERITDDYYMQAGTLIFHESCANMHSVDSYVEGQRWGI